MNILSHETVRDLYKAAISANLAQSRRVLLAFIPPSVVESIPRAENNRDQVLLDLDSLNSIDRLEDGSTPLLVWLNNAILLLRPQTQAALFEQALKECKSKLERAGVLRRNPQGHSAVQAASAVQDGVETLFSWVHVSDLHTRSGDVPKDCRDEILDSLPADIESMITGGLPQPDVILIAGDIAFSGGSTGHDEYERATAQIDRIATAARCRREAVFVVPGNHDTTSPGASEEAARLLDALRNGQAALDDLLDDNRTRRLLLARQSSFEAFAAQLAPGWSSGPASDVMQVHRRRSIPLGDGTRVHLIGLDTAFLAGGGGVREGDDRGWLQFPWKHLRAMLSNLELRADDSVLLLSHHPVGKGWFRDEPRQFNWLSNAVHVQLAGHGRAAISPTARSDTDRKLVTVLSGAGHYGHASRRFHYNFGSIVRARGERRLRVWARRWQSEGARFIPDDDILRSPENGFEERALPTIIAPPSERKQAPMRGSTATAEAARPDAPPFRLPEEPSSFRAAIELALENIDRFGDTDIFPFPIETAAFRDRRGETVALLEHLHRNSDECLARTLQPSHVTALTQIGYTSFRWATQLDPAWNAYYLALVLAIGRDLEASRLPKSCRAAISYRFEPGG